MLMMKWCYIYQDVYRIRVILGQVSHRNKRGSSKPLIAHQMFLIVLIPSSPSVQSVVAQYHTI